MRRRRRPTLRRRRRARDACADSHVPRLSTAPSEARARPARAPRGWPGGRGCQRSRARRLRVRRAGLRGASAESRTPEPRLPSRVSARRGTAAQRPGRRTAGGRGKVMTSDTRVSGHRGTPRLLRRGGPSVWGSGDHIGAPGLAGVEGRDGYAGAARASGGLGAISGPPGLAGIEGRDGYAGAARASGGLGAISGPPVSNRRQRGSDED
jgi:hypothetical protein